MARTGGAGAGGVSCFVIDKDAPGLSFGKPEEKLGLHAAHSGAVKFDGVKVGRDQLVGEEGMGLKIALGSLDAGRIGIAMQAVGIARAAFEHAADYALDARAVRQEDLGVRGRQLQDRRDGRPD